jgi:hypothetical protein
MAIERLHLLVYRFDSSALAPVRPTIAPAVCLDVLERLAVDSCRSAIALAAFVRFLRFVVQRLLGLIDSRQSLRLRRFLRFLSTEAPLLPRRYPASSLIRASPSPQMARPDSRELPVDRQGHHRWGFPCCYWSTLPACRRHYPGRSDGRRSLVLSHQQRPSR